MLPLLALDTETHLIAPGRAAPRLVCTAASSRKDGTWLVHRNESKALWKWALRGARDGRWILTNVNMMYDAAVVLAAWPDMARLIFDAYESGNVRCSIIDQRLIDIANGVLESKARPKAIRYYSAKALAKRRLDIDLAKGEDTWQLRYAELEPEPDIEKWPIEAQRYPKRDARTARKLAEDIYEKDGELLRDSGEQAYTAFALYLQTCRGIRTDSNACRKLIKALETELERCERVLRAENLLGTNTKGKTSKNLTLARKMLRATLPRRIRSKLDQAIQDAKSYASRQAKEQRVRVQARWELDDKDFARAESRLARLLRKDISHDALLKKWRSYDYSEQLYVELRSLVRKPRPYKALGVEVSKTGLISVKAPACRASGDEALKAQAMYTSANNWRKKAQRLLKGSVIPLQTSYQTVINSGRTSSRSSDAPLVGDNYQNFARSAIKLVTDDDVEYALPGIRECIIPRPKYVFCSIDFDAAEMRSYAQIEYEHLGVSELRIVLNAGQNPHRVLGAYILGISEKSFEKRYAAGDEDCIRAAQFAKIPNFALLGGGGYKILPDYAAGMGIKLDLGEAKELYEAFHSRWCHVAEMHKHFKTFIHKVYEHPYSRRLRYIDRYAQACNNPFQGLTADAAKLALRRLARASYVPGGELWGSYPVLFLHDEVLFELRQDCASEHAWRATRIMVDSYNHYTPDVPMTATPALMPRFLKGAKTVLHPTKLDRDGNKKLIIYEPKEAKVA
jgi:hypothetical protein